MDCFRESPLQHFKAVYRPYTEYAAIVNRENGQIQVSAKDHLNELAWKTHRLVYQNTPLREVVADLEKLYQIKLKNIPPQNLKLTATFDTMEISDILYIINQTLDTNLTITIQQ